MPNLNLPQIHFHDQIVLLVALHSTQHSVVAIGLLHPTSFWSPVSSYRSRFRSSLPFSLHASETIARLPYGRTSPLLTSSCLSLVSYKPRPHLSSLPPSFGVQPASYVRKLRSVHLRIRSPANGCYAPFCISMPAFMIRPRLSKP